MIMIITTMVDIPIMDIPMVTPIIMDGVGVVAVTEVVGATVAGATEVMAVTTTKRFRCAN